MINVSRRASIISDFNHCFSPTVLCNEPKRYIHNRYVISQLIFDMGKPQQFGITESCNARNWFRSTILCLVSIQLTYSIPLKIPWFPKFKTHNKYQQFTVFISGPKCDVNVYDTSEWTGPPVDGACVVPSVSTMFTHTGHKACSEQSGVRIATHIWHPTSEALVFSAASDGALHAWQYVSQAAKLSD